MNFPATCTSIHCVQIAFKVSENYVQWFKRRCVDNRFNTIFNIQMAKIESSKKGTKFLVKTMAVVLSGQKQNGFPWKIY